MQQVILDMEESSLASFYQECHHSPSGAVWRHVLLVRLQSLVCCSTKIYRNYFFLFLGTKDDFEVKICKVVLLMEEKVVASHETNCRTYGHPRGSTSRKIVPFLLLAVVLEDSLM